MNEHNEEKANPFLLAAIVLIVTIMILGAIDFVRSFGTSEIRYPNYLDTLEKELRAVPIPEGSQAHSEVRRSYKQTRMYVSRSYQSAHSSRGLEDFYDQALAKQGWRLAEKKKKLFGDEPYLRYCKQDLAVSVQVLETKPSVVYSIGILWPSGSECTEPSTE